MITAVAQQKGGVGKTTTAINLSTLLARAGRRMLVIDTDPQAALTRQLGIASGTGATLVDALTGEIPTAEAIRTDVHGIDVLPASAALAGVEMSLVSEMGRERFLADALTDITNRYDDILIDTPPNLGLLTVNALVCASRVLAPVSAEDEGAVHGVLALRTTIDRLTRRLAVDPPRLEALITRWHPIRVSARLIERTLISEGLRPVARIPNRSSAIARAANEHVPLAALAPDHAVTLAYQRLADQPAEVTAR